MHFGSWKDPKNHFINAVKNDWYISLMDVQNDINHATQTFYRNQGIKTLFLPITTGAISSPMGLGSDSKPVKINIAGLDTYLADSMQFMLEYACRLNTKGAYYIMPSFRGEDEDERHLSQFYHSEAEIPGTLNDVMALCENYFIYVTEEIMKYNHKIVEKIAGGSDHINHIVKKKTFPKVTFDEAVKILDKLHNGGDIGYKDTGLGFRMINNIGEQKLIKHFDGAVWLTHFDALSVPFYQSWENEKAARNADLLIGIGETIGSGERCATADETRKSLDNHKVAHDSYEWYIRMKDEYPMKTTGFGMGIERYILWLLKHNDVRDCQILPRFNGMNILP